jgi:hypothetical protein
MTAIGISLSIASIVYPQSSGSEATSRAQSRAGTESALEKQRKEVEEQARTDLSKDAIAAIEESRQAVKAIGDSKTDEAIAAIERATGKIAILVARKPGTALIPVDVGVEIVDTAPHDSQAIKDVTSAVEKALANKDYPLARVLLEDLSSEIRVRTYHLPLATYPLAMQDAARLLEQKKSKEAAAVLKSALNTLVVIERSVPLPLTVAQAAINDAREQRESDRTKAQKLMTVAKEELERARALGYAGNDSDYAALTRAIEEIDKELKGGGNTATAFEALKDKMASFFKKVTETAKSPKGK